MKLSSHQPLKHLVRIFSPSLDRSRRRFWLGANHEWILNFTSIHYTRKLRYPFHFYLLLHFFSLFCYLIVSHFYQLAIILFISNKHHQISGGGGGVSYFSDIYIIVFQINYRLSIIQNREAFKLPTDDIHHLLETDED